jgi:hypothetical protein
VELIRSGVNKHESTIENYVFPIWEFLADYLLANGIVVPPFKIGETLYDISEYVYGIPSPEIYEMENDRMTIEKIEDGDFIFIYEDAEIRHEDMGEVIFTSREEALAKLKGEEK